MIRTFICLCASTYGGQGVRNESLLQVGRDLHCEKVMTVTNSITFVLDLQYLMIAQKNYASIVKRSG